MSNNSVVIPSLQEDFVTFLSAEKNDRIFFSAKFGTGKTHFLKECFNDEGYDVYHLFPVNYQISSNDNILDLLKYDILTELVSKYPDLLNENAENSAEFINDALRAFYLFAGNNKAEVLKNVLSYIPMIGKPMEKTIDLMKKFSEHSSSIQETDSDNLNKFLSTFSSSSSSDPIIEILKNKIKEKKGEYKKSVLILDDLDRIDPDHIFRLLNIFSAHFDQNENDANKFGFDKVIFVADLENIKNIFHHKYGEKTDFSGYINKYFSVEPYIFSNKKIVNEIVSYLFESCIEINSIARETEKRKKYIEIFFKAMLLNVDSFRLKNISLREFLIPAKVELVIDEFKFRDDIPVEDEEACQSMHIALFLLGKIVPNDCFRYISFRKVEEELSTEEMSLLEKFLKNSYVYLYGYDKLDSNIKILYKGFNKRFDKGRIPLEIMKREEEQMLKNLHLKKRYNAIFCYDGSRENLFYQISNLLKQRFSK